MLQHCAERWGAAIHNEQNIVAERAAAPGKAAGIFGHYKPDDVKVWAVMRRQCSGIGLMTPDPKNATIHLGWNRREDPQ